MCFIALYPFPEDGTAFHDESDFLSAEEDDAVNVLREDFIGERRQPFRPGGVFEQFVQSRLTVKIQVGVALDAGAGGVDLLFLLRQDVEFLYVHGGVEQSLGEEPVRRLPAFGYRFQFGVQLLKTVDDIFVSTAEQFAGHGKQNGIPSVDQLVYHIHERSLDIRASHRELPALLFVPDVRLTAVPDLAIYHFPFAFSAAFAAEHFAGQGIPLRVLAAFGDAFLPGVVVDGEVCRPEGLLANDGFVMSLDAVHSFFAAVHTGIEAVILVGLLKNGNASVGFVADHSEDNGTLPPAASRRWDSFLLQLTRDLRAGLALKNRCEYALYNFSLLLVDDHSAVNVFIAVGRCADHVGAVLETLLYAPFVVV